MQSRKSKFGFLAITLAASVCVLTGCTARMTPQLAQATTTLAVYEYAKNNPKGAAWMRKAQPPACAIATRQGVTLEDVLGEIQNADENEDKAALNLLLTIFQTSTATTTNAADQYPYFKAIFCDGWDAGLALAPTTRGVNAPPAPLAGKRWLLVK